MTMRYLSLFSGMEAAHIAWHPLGWECCGVAEIEPAPCALLRFRLPSVPNLGDVSMVTDEMVAGLGRIDVVIGGSPCQDLSVAGKRAGLAGARSSLFHEQLRIFHAARTLCGARWLIWENVPGAFSSNKGRDFAAVVGAMAGIELDVPDAGWGNEGVALGEAGLVEWSVLDSQWFGVAQRRRRVFAVLDTGDWAGRPPVLLESESLRGDSAPSREAGEGIASTVVARAGSSSGPGIRAECEGGAGLIPTLARCDTTGEGTRQDWETCTIIPAVAHTLRGDGFDASEDGTGRGTPLIPVAHVDTMPTMMAAAATSAGNNARSGHTKDSYVVPLAVALRGREGWATAELGDDVAFALRASTGGGDKPHVMAFAQNQRDEVRLMEVAGALAAEPGMKQQTYAMQGMAVRRLLPVECERLQSAPDNWTLVPNANGKPMADGPRYKMLGNSFTASVIRWIGSQIQLAHTWHEELAA